MRVRIAKGLFVDSVLGSAVTGVHLHQPGIEKVALVATFVI